MYVLSMVLYSTLTIKESSTTRIDSTRTRIYCGLGVGVLSGRFTSCTQSMVARVPATVGTLPSRRRDVGVVQ